MIPEGFHNLVPATGEYPEPDQCDAHGHILFTQDPILISSSLQSLYPSSGYFSSDFPTEHLYAHLISAIRST